MARAKKSRSAVAEMADTLRREFYADYDAGKRDRLTRRRRGTNTGGTSGDYNIRNESEYMYALEVARDIDRNDIVVSQAVSRLTDLVIQDGFKLDPQTGDDALDADLKARWQDYASDPARVHSEQDHTFHELEQLVFRQSIVDHDIFALPISDGTIELVEAHRCRTPTNSTKNIVEGVLLDDRGRRRGFYFTRKNVTPSATVSRVADTRLIPARDRQGFRNVFQVYRPNRVSLRRGYTALAPVVRSAGMNDDIQFSALVARQVASIIAFIRERHPNAQGKPPARPALGDREAVQDGGIVKVLENMQPGMVLDDTEGKYVGWSPTITPPDFKQHTLMVLSFIAVNLSMPVQLLLLDPTMTNFSGWRGAIDQARMSWRRMQNQLITRFHREVYQWQVRRWMAQDAAMRNSAAAQTDAIFRHVWRRPRWPYIQPMEDAKARILRRDQMLASPRDIAAEDGYDLEDIQNETIADNSQFIRKAVAASRALSTELGIELEWRDVLRLPLPNQINVSVSESESTTATEGPE